MEHAKGDRITHNHVSGYVQAVIAIAEAVQGGLPLRRVPLVLFAKGLPVRVEVLRAAYLDLLTNLMGEIGRIGADEDSGSHDPGDKADVLAIRMAARGARDTAFPWAGRRAREASHQAEDGVSGRSLLASAWSAALTGPVMGVPASEDGITEALTVFGLNDGQDPRDVAEHLATLTFDAICGAVQSATLEQWTTARADLAVIVQLADVRRRVETRILPKAQQLVGLAAMSTNDPVSQAAFLAGLLVIANDEWRQNLRSESARWKAINQLLSALPERFDRFILQQEAPEDVLVELRPILTDWATRHPAKAAS